jgi:uncharacterized membrane protein
MEIMLLVLGGLLAVIVAVLAVIYLVGWFFTGMMFIWEFAGVLGPAAALANIVAWFLLLPVMIAISIIVGFVLFLGSVLHDHRERQPRY